MSLVPVDFRQFKEDRKTNHRFRPKQVKFLLNWNSVISKVRWNVILLFGGGLALAESTQRSGLSRLFTEQLVKMNIKSPKLFVAFLTIFCAFFTEIVSSSAVTGKIIINSTRIELNIDFIF